MNKEKSHVQGYIVLKNSFLCLLLSKQSKRKVIEKNHSVTQKQFKKPPNSGLPFPRTEQVPRNHEKMPFSM